MFRDNIYREIIIISFQSITTRIIPTKQNVKDFSKVFEYFEYFVLNLLLLLIMCTFFVGKRNLKIEEIMRLVT